MKFEFSWVIIDPNFFSLKVRLMYQSLTKKFRDVDGVLKDPGCRSESILQVYNSTIYNQGMIQQVFQSL